MSSLFSDNFLISKTDEDLKNLQIQYPGYDSYYIASCSIPDRKKYFDDLYNQFEPYADRNFLIDVKNNFHQRTWEMYMACLLLKNDIQISSQDIGPDIKIAINGTVIWIECVACTKGSGNDSVPPLRYDGSLQDLPEKEMLLRITNSLDDKFKKYKKYINDGIVKKGDIYIIAINRADLDHFDPGIPLVFKALFGIGYLSFPMQSLRKTENKREPFWSIRPAILKQNGKYVSVKFFEAQEHSGISAVIYSKDNILNCRDKSGEECILVHNPFASNSLPEGSFPFFEQYKSIENKIVKI